MGEERSINFRKVVAALAAFTVLVGLYFASNYNYLLFHVLAEGFSVAVACGIFMMAWNARRFIDNNYVLFIGIAFLFIGGLDLLHTMSYGGMNLFRGYDNNLPTQLWISARYMQSISMFVAPFFIGRAFSANKALGTYAAASAIILWAAFSGLFPDCFIEGQGLTPFKKVSEYVISLILAGSFLTLRANKDIFAPNVLRLLYWSIALTIASELAFTFYVSVYGFSNLVGHYLKLVSFLLIYRAVVVTGLREPYSLLFRNLKEREDRLRGFSDAAFEGIVVSEGGKILDMNRQAVEMFGYGSTSDVVGIDGFDLVAPESREMVRAIVLEGRENPYEATFMRRDGSKFEAIVRGRMLDYHGRRVRIAAISDITERKRAEEATRNALEKSMMREREVEALLRGSRAVLNYREFKPAARAIFDSCRALIGATAGYVALLSRDGSENEVLFLDSGGFSCSVDPSLPMPIRGLRAEAYRACKVVYDNDFSRSEWMKYMPDGHVELRNVMFTPLVIEGKAVGLMGIANKEGDFTDNDARLATAFGELAAIALSNSRALESLEESEERFRSVAQSASDAIISSDRDGNVIFWNAAAETVFGYSADEMMGKSLRMIMPEPFRQRHEEAMAYVRFTGQLKGGGGAAELEGVRKDGVVFPIELSLSQWKTGEEVFFSAIIRDITNRKLAEEELNRYRGHLEEVVSERTKELIKAYEELEQQIVERNKAEAQLRQSQKMEAVGVLAGGIAHDFNNRLFAIRNYAHILKAKVKDDSELETLEKLIASCDKAAGLVDDLMRFSREKAINPKPVDANSIVREARNILEMAAGKAVELVTELYPQPLQVMADTLNMEHVLLNLVNNARDVMPEGGKITISTGRAVAESVLATALDGGKECPCAVISVSDTGPGLQEGTKDRIFEPFFTTKDIGKGTGLGLSIVYGVVKQHGGFVDVTSEPGRGTTFRIFLPLL